MASCCSKQSRIQTCKLLKSKADKSVCRPTHADVMLVHRIRLLRLSCATIDSVLSDAQKNALKSIRRANQTDMQPTTQWLQLTAAKFELFHRITNELTRNCSWCNDDVLMRCVANRPTVTTVCQVIIFWRLVILLTRSTISTFWSIVLICSCVLKRIAW